MKSLIPLAAILLLLGCAPASRTAGDATTTVDVHLTAESAGTGTVLLTLHNGSSESVGYNLCSSTLERRDGETWATVPSDEMCTMEVRTLAPSNQVSYEKTLPAGTTNGEYRYVTSIESPLGSGMQPIASTTFIVR